MKLLALVLALLLAACGGPSTADVRQARAAHYTVRALAAFDQAIQGAQDAQWQVDESDPQRLGFRTNAKWFEPDGTSEDRSDDDNAAWVVDGSILLAFVVYVKGSDGDCWIEINPLVYEKVGGSPQPRQLTIDDPSMPGWVHGKLDNLYVAIHSRLKAHMVGAPAASAGGS